MPGESEPFEDLRDAIDQAVADDARELISEARAQARARVRAQLTGAFERSLLGRIHEQLVGAVEPDATPQEPGRPADDGAVGDDEFAWYVYGVTTAEVSPLEPLRGVDGTHPATLLREGSVAAIASQVPLAEFGEARLREHLADMDWVETIARAHERVLEEVRDRVTVIPMRMCTVYRAETGLREMLNREADALREAIDRLDGKAEWGVKVFAVAQTDAGAPAVSGAAEADAGATYMKRRREERDERERERQRLEQAAEAIHERLGLQASDALILPPHRPEVSGHSGEMILNGVYLVDDQAAGRFAETLDELEGQFAAQGIELELTGPWPAYNFVPGTIGASW